jgi:hypothetical protein
MIIKLLILLHFICVHCTYGSDASETSQRSKPLWFRIVRTKRANRIDQTGLGKKFRLEDLENGAAEYLKIPLPEKLIFKKTYDFFDEVPRKLRYFMINSLNFPNFRDGAEIITLPGWLDRRGHVTEGRIGNTKVILKRSKSGYSNDPNEREMFYKFMDAAKEKLKELAAIAKDHTLSKEEKKLRTQQIRRQLTGLGDIVPIVGTTQIQRPDESSPGKFVNETIEISPKVNGHTLYDCIEKKLPPYDTPQGIPRNQNIAIKLLLQLTHANFTLHSCGYRRNDSNNSNIMIAQNGHSFTLTCIDWESLSQAKQPSDLSKDIRGMIAMFRQILLGKQYISNKDFSRFPQQESDIKKCLKKHFRLLRKAKIYSPQTIDTIMKLLKDMLLKNDEKEPDLEMIILKLEALLDGNKGENNTTKENSAENFGEIKEKNGEESTIAENENP